MIINNQTPENKKSKRTLLITVFLVLVIFISIIYYAYYKLVLSRYEETENAYVNGNIINVTSEIRGMVTAVYAEDTKAVKEGDILIKLNPQDAEISLNKAKAMLGTTVRGLREQYANVNQFKALKKQQQIALEKAETDYNRRVPLAAKGIISKEELAHAKVAVLSAKAALEVTKEQELTANANIAGVTIVNHPSVMQAKSAFIEAWLNLKRTTILAPISGYIAKKNAQVGSMVTPGTPLLSIVPLKQLWIDANFKETQLKHIKVNQDVTIIADVYGNKVEYHGKVVGLSAGTGSAFSLLPAQNATGNWIKIVQRVPVRISLDAKELEQYPLLIGLSTTVKVDISDQSGENLYQVNNKNVAYTTNVITKDLKEAEEIANKIINENINSFSNNKKSLNSKNHTYNKKVTANKAIKK